MSIQEISSNFKLFFERHDATLALLIIAVGIGSFFLGRASVTQQNTIQQAIFPETSQPTRIIETSTPAAVVTKEVILKAEDSVQADAHTSRVEGGYVASKSGTKYHLPWCSGAQRIKEENKIWFATKAEAEAAGYEPAANCKGI